MHKRGQMMMGGPRKPISLLLGIAFLILGVIPLLNSMGLIGLNVPTPVGMILWVLSIIAGIFLLWDALSENMSMMGLGQQIRMITFIAAPIVLAIGVIPILNGLGVVGFALPAFGETIIQVLFIIIGVLLLYGGTQGF